MAASWRKKHMEKPDFHKKEEDIILAPATRFFDQMSFIGDEVVGCFVIETAKGIVLLDCMHPDERCRTLIECGLRDLGLHPEDIYAIVISHGHGDHFGKADYFKEKYGAKLYLSEIDYRYAKNMPASMPWEPVTFTVDHYLFDGEELDFGDCKIKCVFTPGHTDGCFSFIVPVTDEGRLHHTALWGGSGILKESDVEAYYHSWLKFSEICRDYHVDSEIATHPCLDNGLLRLELVRNIVDGVPNPFVIGEDGYHYYEKQFYDLVMKFRN